MSKSQYTKEENFDNRVNKGSVKSKKETNTITKQNDEVEQQESEDK